MNKQNVSELYAEWEKLSGEQLSFGRAGIDDLMTSEMHKRANYGFTRINAIEKKLFPLLTNRITLTFKNKDRPQSWEERDKILWKGYIIVDDDTDVDYRKNTVTGKITFAKKP